VRGVVFSFCSPRHWLGGTGWGLVSHRGVIDGQYQARKSIRKTLTGRGHKAGRVGHKARTGEKDIEEIEEDNSE
jgi:hypothetical protein